MGFSRQEYWSGFHALIEEIFLTQGSNPLLLCILHWQADSLPLVTPGVLKNRDITLLRKDLIVKTMIFPVVVYGCEGWTIKKANGRRIDTFELWCWRRLLSVPWTAMRSNQSIIKEISLVYSLEQRMLKLKLQIFGHLMCRTDSLEKTLMLGKIEGRRKRG